MKLDLRFTTRPLEYLWCDAVVAFIFQGPYRQENGIPGLDAKTSGGITHLSEKGFLTATDLAEYLVQQNIPFRQAHAIVGQAVAYCIANRKELTDLSLTELQEFNSSIKEDVFEVLGAEGSINSRNTVGGTATAAVLKALAQAEAELGI